MIRLCIVAHDASMLYGYLMVVFERELKAGRMEIVLDRRRRGSPPGGAPLGMERRTHPPVEDALQTRGYVILDENGNLAAPERLPAWSEAVLLWKSVAGWASKRVRSAWQARPAGTVVRPAAVLRALAVSAVLVAAQLSTRVDRRAVLRGAESVMPSTPTQSVMVASSPTVAAPPAPVVAPPEPEAGSMALADSTPAPAVVASPSLAQPPAPAGSLVRRTPAAAPSNPTPQPSAPSRAEASRHSAALPTSRARESAPSSEKPAALPVAPAAEPAALGPPIVVLEIDPQGKGDERSITYTAHVSDASGGPLTNAEVSLHGWMADGSDLQADLGSTSTPGTYQGSVQVGVYTPGHLRVSVAHSGNLFEIAPQRHQR